MRWSPGSGWRLRAAVCGTTLVMLFGVGDGVRAGASETHGQAGVDSAFTLQPETPNLFYNRNAAVRWALEHAQDEQTVGAMCTWFVSNALWAGGFPRSEAWTDAGSHGTLQPRPGSVAAWAVPEFLQHIQANFSTTWTDLGLLSDQNNAVPVAEPGDIIAYDWGHGDEISHIAFVVSISPGSYPNVAEWGQPDLVTPLSNFHAPYQSRGWTWSEMSGTWLQEAQGGNVRAYLLHINGGVFVEDF